MRDIQKELASALKNNTNIDSTPIKAKAQAKTVKTDKVITLKDRGNIEYNPEEVRTFLDLVFHKKEATDNILTWSPKTNRPAFPSSLDNTFKKLENTNLPRTFYFGTATTSPDVDGTLKNRKALFTGLHVVVLDDIGTKIPEERLPEALAPNYIIESSEGNFQYGYILDTPIRDLALAEALIHLVYTSGLSDGGGKLPNKLVRLPCGINGKDGDKGDFRVRLIESNDEYWTPQELLDVMDVGVTWDEVVKDTNAANGGASARKVGTSLWSPVQAKAASLNGVVDPMLEWLYEEDMVKNDNGGWATIQCPWSSSHTTGGDTAGYSPVGRGGDHSTTRGFHCFHDGCKDKTIHDFLELLALEGAPQVPVRDMVADLVADYAYISSEDAAVRIRGVNTPTCMKVGAFRNTFPRKSVVYEANGKTTTVPDHALWLTAPNRLTLAGRMYDPTSDLRICEHDHQKYLNNYTAPTWGTGSYDDKDVNKFKQFLKYLIPTDCERDYFTQWLAAKAQNVCFKGAAILMVAPTQGTGRTTLTDMITQLFQHGNVNKVNFPTLCSAGGASPFNAWQEALIVTCDEVMTGDKSKYNVYEGLKDLFDPKPKQTLVNPKFGFMRMSTLYTSYILLTNHTDAIGALGDDRRVYTIQNTVRRNTPEYYSALNKWIDTKDEQGEHKWARSIWRWLQTLEPDIELLNSPAPMTDGKLAMIEDTSSICDVLHEIIFDDLGGVISTPLVESIAETVLFDRGVEGVDSLKAVTKRRSNASSVALKKTDIVKEVFKLKGKVYRLRLSHSYLRENGLSGINEMSDRELALLVEEAKTKFTKALDNPKAVSERLNAVLDERGL